MEGRDWEPSCGDSAAGVWCLGANGPCAVLCMLGVQALAKLEETWGKVEFVFTPHHNRDVATVKMAEVGC